jgi:DNA-binding transcriptional MerR regulator
MYTIGQFSKLCRVSTKALRHYEKIGLFLPAHISQENKYRYYSAEQVDLMKTILVLRDFGFPLASIKNIMEKIEQPNELFPFVEEHREHLLNELEVTNRRLVQLAWWKQNIGVMKVEEKKKYDILIKEVAETKVKAERKKLKNFPETLPPMIRDIYQDIEQKGGIVAGPPIILYHDEEFHPEETDIEVAFPVEDDSIANTKLPKIKAAGYMHVGPYEGLEEVYQELFSWVNKQGLTSTTPYREISHNDPTTTPPDQLVTEVLIPIKE